VALQVTKLTANTIMLEQFSPIRLFVTLLALIFCIEGAMMCALDDLLPSGTPVWVGASIDAGLLTAITSLFVWWLFMRPLRFALLSETAQAKVVMDTAVEGIVTVSERGVIEYFNRAAGDKLLKCVADRLRRQVRESDTVARVGGDELTLLLPVIAGRKDAANVAEKIIAALSASFLVGKQEVCIGTSIGIAIYPADAAQTDALVKAADAAMYKAKQFRNCFRFYSE